MVNYSTIQNKVSKCCFISIARKETIKLSLEYVVLYHDKPLITYRILQIIPLPVLLLFCQSLY